MSLDLVVNVVIAGLLTGLVYGLMALGLSVIFGVVRVVNFAHGEMMTIAMYAATVLFAALKLDPFLAMLPVAAAAALFAFFKFTLTGKAIRACADNYLGAKVVGLNVKKYYSLTFGLGSACVAVAGCAMVLLVDVTPPLGPYYTLLAFVIVIVGGLGSMTGALLGGVLIGVSEALAGLFIAPSAKSMFSFGLLILVLLLRPQGLLGRRP